MPSHRLRGIASATRAHHSACWSAPSCRRRARLAGGRHSAGSGAARVESAGWVFVGETARRARCSTGPQQSRGSGLEAILGQLAGVRESTSVVWFGHDGPWRRGAGGVPARHSPLRRQNQHSSLGQSAVRCLVHDPGHVGQLRPGQARHEWGTPADRSRRGRPPPRAPVYAPTATDLRCLRCGEISTHTLLTGHDARPHQSGRRRRAPETRSAQSGGPRREEQQTGVSR